MDPGKDFQLHAGPDISQKHCFAVVIFKEYDRSAIKCDLLVGGLRGVVTNHSFQDPVTYIIHKSHLDTDRQGVLAAYIRNHSEYIRVDISLDSHSFLLVS